MPANRCSALAAVALGSLILAGACVDLTPPKSLTNGAGGQGGTAPDAAVSPNGGTTTGTGGAIAGGAGGASTGGVTTGGTGGVATGGAGGITTSGTGGVDAAATGGVTTGGAGGVTTVRTGGITTGGAGGVDAATTGGVTTGGAGGVTTVRTGGVTTVRTGGVATGGTRGGGTVATGGTATGGTTTTGGSTSPDGAVPDVRPPNDLAPVEMPLPPDPPIDGPAAPDVPQIPDLSPDLPPAIPGLVLYYNCNAVNTATLPDMSNNGNDGTLVGPFTIATGKVGNALAFAGTATSGGYVVMPQAILAGSTTMTIAAWFKINSTLPFQRIFDIGTSDTTSSMYLTPRDGSSPNNLRFSIRTTLADGSLFQENLPAAPVITIPVNTWEHVAVVLDSSGGRLYLNGALVGSNAAMTMRPSTLGNTPNDWIGRSQFAVNPYLDGAIDEFRIYNRGLSAAEITALYNFAGH
jgi:hypothetical protein